MIEEYQPRFKSVSDANTGDPVYYYKDRSGWGGGETYRLFAVVLGRTAKRVVIGLWNVRKQSVEEHIVQPDKLSRRTQPYPMLDGSFR